MLAGQVLLLILTLLLAVIGGRSLLRGRKGIPEWIAIVALVLWVLSMLVAFGVGWWAPPGLRPWKIIA